MTPYLTIQEVAELARCEHRTVRRAIRNGELTLSLIGGRWIVRADAVEKWFDARASHRILPPAPPPARPAGSRRPHGRAQTGGSPRRPASVADPEAIRERILRP
jgi:excisionase family DNA binding protein